MAILTSKVVSAIRKKNNVKRICSNFLVVKITVGKKQTRDAESAPRVFTIQFEGGAVDDTTIAEFLLCFWNPCLLPYI